MVKKKTAGQQILEHTAGKEMDDATPHELSQEMLEPSFDASINEWIREACGLYDNDFFIVLNLKLERSLQNAPHLIPETRQTCPDPFYDQSVWHFHREEERLEFLWVVPDIGTTKLFYDDPLNCPTDQLELRKHVLDFMDGTLQKRANKLNEVILRSKNGRKKQSRGIA